jgi:fucose permease
MFPVSLNFAERHMPITGRVTAYFLIGANTGSMILPWLIGQLFETLGPQSMVVIIQAAMLVALFLFTGMVRYASKFRENPSG